ncbi:S41 family peptidase [Gymnodinialimonas sp. 2305UL16-5]|uniref:S41 family peptidase n=1 Tax=Gymnodinialimonas mytili TaxID=3126503 RepID=UPI0030A61D29
MFEDADRISIQAPLEPHQILAERMVSLPPECIQAATESPLAVFEAFVGYFDANYPFFELYDVDWSERVNEARQRINADMGECELFDVLDWLIEPLQDGHVSLVATINGDVVVSAPGRARVLQGIRQGAEAARRDPSEAAREFRRSVWFDSISQDILQGDGHLIGNDRVQYGMVADQIGYLAFSALDGFGEEGNQLEDNLSELERMLDEIIRFFEQSNATTLIVDLSLNFGGSDFMAREVASRFLHTPTVAYTKYAADALNPLPTRVSIEPDATRFEGDIYLLTSQVTVSAAEVMTLTLRQAEHVYHYGEPTRGAFSDALSRSLPNGWQLSMSNEVYLDASGQHWEAVGVSPEIEMTVFSDLDPIESHRRAIHMIVQHAVELSE